RTWQFDRTNGQWAINGQFFSGNVVRASPRRNSAEIWVLQNNSGGWTHPVHIHLEEFLVLNFLYTKCRASAPRPCTTSSRSNGCSATASGATCSSTRSR